MSSNKYTPVCRSRFLQSLQDNSRDAPAEKPFGFGIAHVHAAVAHLPAEIVVPIGSMQGVTSVEAVEKHCPGHTDQFICVQIQVAAHQSSVTHVFGGHFGIDIETTCGCLAGDAIICRPAGWNAG